MISAQNASQIRTLEGSEYGAVVVFVEGARAGWTCAIADAAGRAVVSDQRLSQNAAFKEARELYFDAASIPKVEFLLAMGCTDKNWMYAVGQLL